MDKHTFLYKGKDRDNISKKYLILFWILILTFISGAINVYAIYNFENPISHHTGNSSALAISIYNNTGNSLKLILIILSFFCGSLISGLLFHEKNLKPQKRYGITIIISGFLILFSNLLLPDTIKIYLLVLIIGVQNALFIKFKGCLVRTSHITGYLTDAGFTLGSILRGKKEQYWILFFYIISIIFFIFGGIFSLFLMENYKITLEILGIIHIFAGIYYFILRKITISKECIEKS